MEYQGIDGFLGSRATLMLDVVFLAMFIVVPMMGWSIYQVRVKRNYLLHKRVQLGLAAALAITVALFEIDMRANGWRDRAAASPYYDSSWTVGWVNWSLGLHLFFAVTTCVLWIYVLVAALRTFPHPPRPTEFSPRHVFWARLAAIDMFLTGVTGCVFYWLAFVVE